MTDIRTMNLGDAGDGMVPLDMVGSTQQLALLLLYGADVQKCTVPPLNRMMRLLWNNHALKPVRINDEETKNIY